MWCTRPHRTQTFVCRCRPRPNALLPIVGHDEQTAALWLEGAKSGETCCKLLGQMYACEAHNLNALPSPERSGPRDRVTGCGGSPSDRMSLDKSYEEQKSSDCDPGQADGQSDPVWELKLHPNKTGPHCRGPKKGGRFRKLQRLFLGNPAIKDK